MVLGPPEIALGSRNGLASSDSGGQDYERSARVVNRDQHAQARACADAFVFVAGEYNWAMHPGLKNLTDHFLEEWFWRPAAIASYSAGWAAGARANLLWHGTLSEMGMVVISSTIWVGTISKALDESGRPIGEAGALLHRSFPRFAEDLAWWTEAAKEQRARKKPPF
jgi:NAD(P)H-dependent FMN reductase